MNQAKSAGNNRTQKEKTAAAVRLNQTGRPRLTVSTGCSSEELYNRVTPTLYENVMGSH